MLLAYTTVKKPDVLKPILANNRNTYSPMAYLILYIMFILYIYIYIYCYSLCDLTVGGTITFSGIVTIYLLNDVLTFDGITDTSTILCTM